MENLTSSFPNYITFISFSCLITFAKNLSTILNEWRVWIACLILDFTGNAFTFPGNSFHIYSKSFVTSSFYYAEICFSAPLSSRFLSEVMMSCNYHKPEPSAVQNCLPSSLRTFRLHPTVNHCGREEAGKIAGFTQHGLRVFGPALSNHTQQGGSSWG
jgi:hypothetical protein